jgi:hypothetical protein
MIVASTRPRRARGALGRALRAESADDCAKELEGIAERFESFREARHHALRGEWAAVVVLVRLWLTLVDELLQLACDEFPDLVQWEDDSFAIRTTSGSLSEDPVRLIDRLVADAPFSPVLAQFGEGLGFGVVAVDAVRFLLPGCLTLRVEVSAGSPDLPDGSHADRYRRLVEMALRSVQPPLVRVKDLFGLNNTELAVLFSVRRQAVDQWERCGDVPASRRERMANLLSVGELLERKLSPGRLALVARRRADVYGGRTMLDLVAEGRDSELRALTERAFDWSLFV